MGGGESFRGEWEKQGMELLDFPPLMIHVALMLAVGWIASYLKFNLLFVYTFGFAYVFYIERRQRQKIRARIRFEERKHADRKRVLSDAETARWLNNVVESVWPIFLEQFASQHFLMRLAPWFLEKYKPWTAKKVLLQQIYLGRTPPVFTLFRAGRYPTDGDHLVLEMTMNFNAAKDMNASMAVQMKKRLGFGLWTSFHISNIQVEGKLKVGVRFMKGWPVIERLRICFSEAPIIRMVAKPVFTHGVDVTDIPGIAAWMDKMIIDALEQSLVEPNLLVVDMEKLVGDLMSVKEKLKTGKTSKPGEWYSDGKTRSVATLLVEILEAEKLKPCDLNGKADPYVKIVLGPTQFLTSIKRKTLYPSWHEQFRIPIESWDIPNLLVLKVRDKDRFHDDEMGHKKIDIQDLKDGQRHDLWLRLDNVKTGRLHVALTVAEMPDLVDGEGSVGGTLQDEDSAGTVGGSRRDAPGSRSTDSNEESMRLDSDETTLKSESQTVDVGVGKSGCIAIVKPGKHVVKEAYGSERLQKRKKVARVSQRESGRSVIQGEEVNYMQFDLASSTVPEVKRSRMRNILGRRNQGQGKEKYSNAEDDVSGELCGEVSELVVAGNKGTEVHMKLDLGDEQLESLEGLGLQKDAILVPETGDLLNENELDSDKLKTKNGSVRKMGKGIVKQAGKMAQNIGHALKTIHPGKRKHDLPRTFVVISPQTSFNDNERECSDEVVRSGECSDEVVSSGECSDEVVTSGELDGREKKSLGSEVGVLEHELEDMDSRPKEYGQSDRHEVKQELPETHPSITSLPSPVGKEQANDGQHCLQGSIEEDPSQSQIPSQRYPDLESLGMKDSEGLQTNAEVDHLASISVKNPSLQITSPEILPQCYGEGDIFTPPVTSTPPPRQPPLPPPAL